MDYMIIARSDALRNSPPALVENRMLFETNDDFTDNGRALFDYLIEKGYNKSMRLYGWSMNRLNIKNISLKM